MRFSRVVKELSMKRTPRFCQALQLNFSVFYYIIFIISHYYYIFIYELFLDLPNKSLLNETKNKEVKAEAYVERWKKLIYAIKKEENQSYVVINPKVEGRVKMIIE